MKMKRHQRRYVNEICVLHNFMLHWLLDVVTLIYHISLFILQAVVGKKRPTESATKTPVPAKKTKGAATPQTGKILVHCHLLCYDIWFLLTVSMMVVDI